MGSGLLQEGVAAAAAADRVWRGGGLRPAGRADGGGERIPVSQWRGGGRLWAAPLPGAGGAGTVRVH